ncbi:SC5A8-like protein [Mya arenaria]|uniref:SC5A8-like protein n=1 Tax=Mya arenaria TaxID=6604 RepID=A0ABY7ENW3_MYAAR|nr:SC5A8-like protein [Mya arenaria]
MKFYHNVPPPPIYRALSIILTRLSDAVVVLFVDLSDVHWLPVSMSCDSEAAEDKISRPDSQTLTQLKVKTLRIEQIEKSPKWNKNHNKIFLAAIFGFELTKTSTLVQMALISFPEFNPKRASLLRKTSNQESFRNIKPYNLFTSSGLCYICGNGIVFIPDWNTFCTVRATKNHNSPEEYFLAGRKSRLLPVTLSFIVTFQSSILMLGFPAEVYLYGAVYVYFLLPIVIAFTFSAVFIVPVFYPLKLTTVYEYLNLRYGNNVLRYVTITVGIVYNIFYMRTIVIYTTVTTVYTSIGGIKAVI